jgi:hypothetical protein
VIVSRLNLICANGHRHYSPPRELPAWVGHECLRGARMQSNGLTIPGRCRELLYPPVVPEAWKKGPGVVA